MSEHQAQNWRAYTETLLRPLAEAERIGIFTDLDGTISHFSPKHSGAVVSPRSLELLSALRDLVTVVSVVSGRAARNAQQVVGLDGVIYVGNHGLERAVGEKAWIEPQAEAHRTGLSATIEAFSAHLVTGMHIEDKIASASVHYREAADPNDVLQTLGPVITELAARNGIRFFHGRNIFELRPPIALHKGTAVVDIALEYALDALVFMGDDTTDADACLSARELRLAGERHGIGLYVDSAHTPDVLRVNSDMMAHSVDDVEDFLAWLLQERQARA